MALIPAALRRDRLFLGGLVLRLAAVLLLVPQVQADWFTPFMAQTLAAPGLDPWTVFLRQGGDPLSFLYGPVLYLAHAPFVALGMGLDRLAGSGTALAQIGFGLSLLATDYALLLVLRALNPEAGRRVVAAYWLSPLVLFIVYWHGQTDLVPALLVTAALLLLRRGQPRAAGAVLGLGIAAKISTLALLPFLLIYLWSHRRHRDTVLGFLGACLGVTLLLQGPLVLFSPGVQAMLASNAELGGIFDIAIPLGSGTPLYVLPMVYLFLLYGAWQVGRMDFDLLFKLLGVAYFVVLLLTPAAVGWYLWVVPFLVGYQLRAGRRGALLCLAFAGAFISHKLLATAAPALPLLGLAQGWPARLGLDALAAPGLQSLLLSVQVALGAVLALTMYRRGVEENDFFRLAQRPVAIGIAGDSGTGKDTLALALAGLFGEGAVTQVSGDDYHLFERRGKLWQAFTHLDPRANDLEGFTRDVFSLLAWRPIRCRHYDHATGLFTPPRPIPASDFVLVTGLHALYPPVLRQRLDVAVFLDMDEDLRRFFKIRRDVGERGHPLQRVLDSIERRRIDYEAHILPQRDRADVVLSLLPADPELLQDTEYTGPLPLKLRVRMRSAIGVDRLARLLIALCGAQVDVTLGSGDVAAELIIEGGDVLPEEIQFLARELLPHCEELLARAPAWQPGMTGIMQLIVLLQFAELLPRRRLEACR